jgi:hypothetical protein
MTTYVHLWQYVAEFFLEWHSLENICRENQNTHFMFNNYFHENGAIYEIVWKNMVEPDRPQMAI